MGKLILNCLCSECIESSRNQKHELCKECIEKVKDLHNIFRAFSHSCSECGYFVSKGTSGWGLIASSNMCLYPSKTSKEDIHIFHKCDKFVPKGIYLVEGAPLGSLFYDL